MEENGNSACDIERPGYIGLYGCRGHPFTSWKECKFYHNQKLTIGQLVKNRCLNTNGFVHSIEKAKGFVTVRYGNRPCDIHLEHVAELEVLQTGEQLQLFT